ncbi:antigen-presenting glycoprotein CD1d-like protein, partial [Leptotrombidium deliense]
MCLGSVMWSSEPLMKPEAWLSSGHSPGPGRLLLVCHVSGFYPKPLWVMWMRGEQEQQGTQRGDFLPNADGTWYLRATLDVAAGEAAGLACRVKHSSLGGQDLVLYWGEKGLGPSWRRGEKGGKWRLETKIGLRSGVLNTRRNGPGKSQRFEGLLENKESLEAG